MQWDASRFAGFSSAEPWLPLAQDFATRNVAAERADPASLFNLYRRLLTAARARAPALTRGTYRHSLRRGDVLAYLREADGERLLVALNFGRWPARRAAAGGARGTVLARIRRAGRRGDARAAPTLPGHMPARSSRSAAVNRPQTPIFRPFLP